MKFFQRAALFLLITLPFSLFALPVPLGTVEIGLESSDTYQEGLAFLSTDELGEKLELTLNYKGFGLDRVIWVFSDEDYQGFREGFSSAVWWRSRLLEMNIGQSVSRDVSTLVPSLLYIHRGNRYPFDNTEHVLRFVRQGSDYALTLLENSPGADTRRYENKILPVLTLHFADKALPELKEILSEENLSSVLNEYSVEKAAIEAILDSTPNTE